jgi:hypothetical protein
MSIQDALRATPWRLALTDDTMVLDRDGDPVAMVPGDYASEWEQMEAQARLIAAAPALYAALDELRREIESNGYWSFGAFYFSDTQSGGVEAALKQAEIALCAAGA